MVLYILREVRASVVLRLGNLQVANIFNDGASGDFDATGCVVMIGIWQCWRGRWTGSGESVVRVS